MLGGSTCPSCEMPFDKGKKRRLIDSCGHERCYSCLFCSEACPICLYSDGSGAVLREDHHPYETTGPGFCSSEPVSVLATNDDWLDDTSTISSLCGSPRFFRTRINPKGKNLPPRVSHVS